MVALLGACRPESSGGTAAPDAAGRDEARQRADVVVFPDALRVGDRSVNAFVASAMGTCAGGDYDGFRGLWSAASQPLSRDEFEQGWQAVQRIRIRLLRKVILADEAGTDSQTQETAYVVVADVNLDPAHPATRGQPRREVVLLVRREEAVWRLARPPRPLRTWARAQLESDEAADHEADDSNDAARAPESAGSAVD